MKLIRFKFTYLFLCLVIEIAYSVHQNTYNIQSNCNNVNSLRNILSIQTQSSTAFSFSSDHNLCQIGY